MLRKIVVWFTHAPGLWLFYRETLPKALIRANFVAMLLTVGLILACTVSVRQDNRLHATLIVWLFCHIAWGSYLVYKLPKKA